MMMFLECVEGGKSEVEFDIKYTQNTKLISISLLKVSSLERKRERTIIIIIENNPSEL
jgi:hypothetical protein